jgi:hypothetical protein
MLAGVHDIAWRGTCGEPVSKPSLLIIDSDLSTPAMVEAACDPEQIAFTAVRDIESAREWLEDASPDIVLLAGDIPDAAELLLELLGQTILWLGSEDAPGAEMATAVLSKPLDIVSVQLLFEEHLELAPPEALPAQGVEPSADMNQFGVVEAERDALLAEIEVLRRENGAAVREAAAATGAAQRSIDDQAAEQQQELLDAMAALKTQRRTAEVLQTAYGEVEQAHGKLLQRYEALEAERDALAERSRAVSTLREQLEIAQRDNALLKARLNEAVSRADNATRALGLRAAGQQEAEEAMAEVGWWQDALNEVAGAEGSNS